jgi:small GTP-binding protein
MTESTKKIILSGHAGAGKTSLVSRFVHSRFLEKYPSSVGVRINRKELTINDHLLDMIIWDLASKSSQEHVPQSYLLRAAGIIYVVDISQPDTFDNVDADIIFLKNKLPDVPIVVVANKSDTICATKIDMVIRSASFTPDFVCSAKDAINVSEIFERLAELMLS